MANIQTIDRRSLLHWGFSASVLASLPLGNLSIAQSIETSLLEFIGTDKLPINGSNTGNLSDDDFAAISGICEFVRNGWQLDFEIDAYLPRLQRDLQFKTSEAPSYLSEYESTAALVSALASDDPEQVWTTLLFAEFADVDLAPTRLGRARRLVFAEIIAHMIPISGSFKSFGIINYAGFVGGPFAHPDSYRRAGAG